MFFDNCRSYLHGCLIRLVLLQIESTIFIGLEEQGEGGNLAEEFF